MIIEAWRRKKKNIQLPFHLLLQGWCSRWNKPLTFSSTSIKSTQPCDTCTRQMTPPWYRTAFLLGVLLLSVQHKHWIINPPSNLLLCVSLCAVFSWLFWGFFLFLSLSLFQHLCWEHAWASDKAASVSSLGTLPRFTSWLPAPPSWKKLTTVCPPLLHYNPSPQLTPSPARPSPPNIRSWTRL